MKDLPIVVVAPTKKEALRALRNIPFDPDRGYVAIGNRSLKAVEGLRAARYSTFFIEPDRVEYRIKMALEGQFRIFDALYKE